MSNFHCPTCSRFVSNVMAEEYGELQDRDGWNPYYAWHVMGDCKTHGRVEILDHSGEEGCGCWSVGERDCWWND